MIVIRFDLDSFCKDTVFPSNYQGFEGKCCVRAIGCSEGNPGRGGRRGGPW
jgi:hypothetical protein